MRTIGLAAFGFMAAVTLSAAIDNAQAANPYDGAWHVTINTAKGPCGSGMGFGLQIRNGVVLGYGGFNVKGRVLRSGAVRVALSSGQQHANGSGRLHGNSGGGAWRGVGTQGTCTGSWIANRT